MLQLIEIFILPQDLDILMLRIQDAIQTQEDEFEEESSSEEEESD